MRLSKVVAASFLVVLPVLAACEKDKASGTSAPSPTGSAATTVTAPAASAKPAEAQPSDEVKFTKKYPAVGDQRTETASMDMELKMTVDHKPKPIEIQFSKKEKSVEKVEVLAASEKAATKVKVTFVEKSESESKEGKEKTKASAIAGKTYVVESKAGKTVVTTEAGKPAPAAETALVLEAGDEDLGKPSKMLEAMPEKLKIGENATALVEALKAKISEKGKKKDKDPKKKADVDFKDIELKLTGTRKDGAQTIALFDLKMKMVNNDEVEMHVDFTGKVEIRTGDSQLVSLTMSGPIKVGGDQAPAADKKAAKMEMTGSGTMKWSMSVTYP